MYIDALAEGITLSKGLGSRHWAAAAISRKTQAIAIANECPAAEWATVEVREVGVCFDDAN